MYEGFPEFIYNHNIEDLRTKTKSREEMIKSYSEDQEKYFLGIEDCLKNKVDIIQVQLIRPVFALQKKDKELEWMALSGNLDKIMDDGARFYLDLNSSL
jgi:hypothetical protein